MKEPRDNQRSRLYKAEKVLESFSKRLETTQEMAEFINKVMNKAPIQRRYGPYLRQGLTVKDGRGRRVACGGATYIKMPKWARSTWVTLHEVAHSVTSRVYPNVAAHGREYAGVYLDLVRFGIGQEAHDALRDSFKANRVKYRALAGTKGRAKPVYRQRVEFKAAAKVKPKPAPMSWDALEKKREAAARYKIVKIAAEFGFKFKITRDGTISYFETDDFPLIGMPFSTMHFCWIETLDRVTRCIEDPLLIDAEGYYSE